MSQSVQMFQANDDDDDAVGDDTDCHMQFGLYIPPRLIKTKVQVFPFHRTSVIINNDYYYPACSSQSLLGNAQLSSHSLS